MFVEIRPLSSRTLTSVPVLIATLPIVKVVKKVAQFIGKIYDFSKQRVNFLSLYV